MTTKLRQAVVLCAGSGKRLGQLSVRQPKAMLPVGGRPLIQHIVAKLLGEAGFARVVLVVGLTGEPVIRLFQDDSRVRFARQLSPKGTADSLLASSDLLEERFLLTYGDLWVGSADYAGLRQDAGRAKNNRIAINKTTCPKGAGVYLEAGRVTKMVEKPVWCGQPDTHWNASGLYVLNRDFLKDRQKVQASPRGELELTSAIQGAIDRGVTFLPYCMVESHVDIGIPGRYHALCETLSR